MNDLINRYVYDVTRRLPEKDRDEVGRELRANIFDMLPDGADDSQIEVVLQDFGAPALLAEKYRQSPRYLISPAVYDDYINVLKWLIPLVGGVLTVIGVVVSVIENITGGAGSAEVIAESLSKGFGMGISAAFQTLFWVTLGFAITERTNQYKAREWSVNNLPDIPPSGKNVIKLSDSIAELVLTVVFTSIALVMCAGNLPVLFANWDDVKVHTLFNPDFLKYCIPAIAVMGILGVCECIVKLVYRRWTVFVCATVVISNLATAGIMIPLINRPNILSDESLSYLQGVEWGEYDILRFMGKSVDNPVIVLISAFIMIGTLIACAQAVYKTVKAGGLS